MSVTWRKQYTAWMDEVALQPMSEVRDGVIVGILTDAFNDSALTMVDYTELLLRHSHMLSNINAIDSPHGELIRTLAKTAQMKAKKKGLF